MWTLDEAIDQMAGRVAEILREAEPSVYLHGSATLGDFQMGWSDIDLLVLTGRPMSSEQAQELLTLRQTMTEESGGNPFFRLFEGGLLPLEALLTGQSDRVVYWGTRGERLTDRYDLDAFSRCELLDSGLLLRGAERRGCIPRPTRQELRQNVRRHLATIRTCAQTTGRSFYSFGWLLDISRCLYTLRTDAILPKTRAGEWALEEGLCPCREALRRALEIRRTPDRYTNCPAVFDEAEQLGGAVQRYADVLEQALAR